MHRRGATRHRERRSTSRGALGTLSRDARPWRGQQRRAGAGSGSWQPGKSRRRGRQCCPFRGSGGLRPLCLPGGASSGQTPLSAGRCLSAGLMAEAASGMEVQRDAGAVRYPVRFAGPGRRRYPVRFVALRRSPGTRGTQHAWNPCVDHPPPRKRAAPGRMEERCWERALSGRRRQVSCPYAPPVPIAPHFPFEFHIHQWEGRGWVPSHHRDVNIHLKMIYEQLFIVLSVTYSSHEALHLFPATTARAPGYSGRSRAELGQNLASPLTLCDRS